ncbi:MAG: hypothetical protein ABIK09_08475 [Pseudomonadota bacterium]
MPRIPIALLLQALLFSALPGLAGTALAQGDKGCKHTRPEVPPGPVGPLLRAVSILPAVHNLPKGADQVSLSALVALDDKNIILLDGIEARKEGKRWIWDGVRATADGGRRRQDELRKAGARPHGCPTSPDEWLKKIYRSVRGAKWDEVLLSSTYKLNPKAHSLVDDIEADMKACGKSRYVDILKNKLPVLGALAPEIWFAMVTWQITGTSGEQVELGIVPVDGGWRIAHLRIICTK